MLITLPGTPPRWIGLFEAAQDDERQDENALICDTSSGFIRTYEIDLNEFQTIQLDGRERLVLRPGMDLPAPVGYFNVQSDADLVKVLANLLRREASAADAHFFRKRAIEDFRKVPFRGRPRKP